MQLPMLLLWLSIRAAACFAQCSLVDLQLQTGVSISYKEISGLCETTPGVRSFSGYVNLPSTLLTDVGDYNISTFFWFFEARNNASTAPLTIYLAGGPGEPSVYSALDSENGPCYVNRDGNSTTLNPWSFNNYANVLYIDQPVQTGFSYDSLTNATYDLLTGTITPADFSNGIPQVNATFLAGVFASQDPSHTTNTTISSARALWHFAENWLSGFPEYVPTNKKVSIWSNSYGGYWAPAVAAYFDKQIKATNSSINTRLSSLQVDTLGITNGCIDQLVQTPQYPQMAYNNTYGLQLIDTDTYQSLVANFSMSGGCGDLIQQCRALGIEGDPDWTGNNNTVNQACSLATVYCTAYVIGDLSTVNRSDFDISVLLPDPCPVYLPVIAFLNQPWVLQTLGVPLNYASGANVVADTYSLDAADPTQIGTGDPFRVDRSDLDYALNHGIKVAMVYGDRDYRCNWLGGEAISTTATYPESAKFLAAGYQNITTNETYVGGVVRQYGKFSFSRVFDAGHSVSAYQPETVYRIFMRSMFDVDIATGNQSIVGASYSSTGPADSYGISNVLPSPPTTCMIDGEYQNTTQPDFLQ